MLLGLLFGTIASGCAINPPNEPVCFEITLDRGGCIRPLTGEEFEVNEKQTYLGKTWWEMRPTMIMLPASTWEAYKTFTIKMCKKVNCSQYVPTWDVGVEAIDQATKRGQ